MAIIHRHIVTASPKGIWPNEPQNLNSLQIPENYSSNEQEALQADVRRGDTEKILSDLRKTYLLFYHIFQAHHGRPSLRSSWKCGHFKMWTACTDPNVMTRSLCEMIELVRHWLKDGFQKKTPVCLTLLHEETVTSYDPNTPQKPKEFEIVTFSQNSLSFLPVVSRTSQKLNIYPIAKDRPIISTSLEDWNRNIRPVFRQWIEQLQGRVTENPVVVAYKFTEQDETTTYFNGEGYEIDFPDTEKIDSFEYQCYLNQKYTNATWVFEGKSIQAHVTMVAAQSIVIQAALESSMEDAQKMKFQTHWSYHTGKTWIEWCYIGSRAISKETSLYELFTLAAFYEIKQLAADCINQMLKDTTVVDPIQVQSLFTQYGEEYPDLGLVIPLVIQESTFRRD
jgi:hypothetical protein